MREKLIRLGCLLNGHALIYPDRVRDTFTCRCGRKAITGTLFVRRYR